MDVWRESRYIISSFIIIIVCWLGWLCGLVFGQVGEAFTSAVNFPDGALTCLANLAAFFTFILKGKHWHETHGIGIRLAIKNVKERNINGLKVMTTCGENLQKCSVVMLSFHYPATSVAISVMNRISRAFDVHFIFLRCRPLQCGAFTRDFPKCSCTENRDGRCGCIVFNTVQDITMMLARQLPGTLKMKRLSDSHCLIPSVCCLRKGCHGCNQGLLHAENDTLKEGDPNLQSPAAVCEILESIPKVGVCICIPVRPFNEDEWTNELIRVFEPQNGELRGVVFREGGTNASSALENYKNVNGECDADETYSLASLAIVPYLAPPLIMFVLTFLLKVDGVSSGLLAIGSVSSYLFSEGRQIVPHKYLTRARVKSNANNTNVCQVLFFRPAFQFDIWDYLWIFSFVICFFGWIMMLGSDGGAHKWYHIPSMAPSEGRLIVIMVAISIALVMDGFDLKLYLQIRRLPYLQWVNILLFCTITVFLVFQLLYIVWCIAVGRDIGRQIYGTLQSLVFVKGATCAIINIHCEDALRHGKPMWWYRTCGYYGVASALLLNATLAGVRAEWKF